MATNNVTLMEAYDSDKWQTAIRCCMYTYCVLCTS